MRWAIPGQPYRLTGVRVPAALAEAPGAPDPEGFLTLDLWVADGRLALDGPPGAPEVALGGAIALPAFVDAHTHLDKGHIWPRRPNPDGSFMGALINVAEDREANWSAEDVRRRMDFSLRCAWAHGTGAIRTHLDSVGKQAAISWGVFRETREEWRGRIALQAACLVGIEDVGPGHYEWLAGEVARSGGVLGAVAYPAPDLDERLDLLFRLADRHGLAVDLHADETQDPDSRCLRAIAEAKLRARFEGPVLVGHCCSLARQPDGEARATIARVAEAGLDVVSLPLCNLYLQDRAGGRTPRHRGVTLVHELAAAGVRVAFASDNTRDPFYAYGDMDMLEVLREATRVCHLDHPFGDWPAAVGRRAAAATGLSGGVIAAGAPADLTLFPARRWTELLSRPHSDRQVLRAGRPSHARPPDYAELDDLMETR